MLKWYPVYTNSRAEKKATLALQEKAIEVYLPLQKQVRHWSDRKKIIEMPLIPSYLFVKILSSQFTDVLTCKGISRFIYFSGKIATVPERQINQLKLLLANAIDLEIVDQEFKTGKKVIVTGGPLQGLTGELVSWQSSQKVLVKIDYITQAILVQISKAFLEVV